MTSAAPTNMTSSHSLFDFSNVYVLDDWKDAFIVAYVAATAGVLLGVYWESEDFPKDVQEYGWSVLVRSLAVELLCGTMVFAIDGRIGHIQRSEIRTAIDRATDAGFDAVVANNLAEETSEHAAQLEKDAAVARLETAKANESAANANKATEELRHQNLELEQAIAPRILNQAGPDRVLKAFPGQIVQLETIMEFEAQRLAGELSGLFKSAGWDLRPADPKFSRPLEGVTIEYFRRAGTAEPDANQTQRAAAAKALADELKKQNIEAMVTTTAGDPKYQEELRASGMTIEAIRVTVGPKPTRYFLEQRYPWIKEQRERFEKMQEEIDRKSAEARARMNKALQERGLPLLPPDP